MEKSESPSPIAYTISHNFERDNAGKLTSVLFLKIVATSSDDILYTLEFCLCEQKSFLKLKEKLDKIANAIDVNIALLVDGLRYKDSNYILELWLNTGIVFAFQKAFNIELNKIRKEIDGLVCTEKISES